MAIKYVHGYSARETERLYDQAGSVRDLLHHDTVYPPGSLVLEAGCGVGAQTVTLARNSPETHFISVDISAVSLAQARELAAREKLAHVEFLQADLFHLPLPEAHFDHVFVCYVLEHLADPVAALRALHKVLKPGGTLTVIEGDHGSCYWHPETDQALRAWRGLIEVQARAGGNSLIGRQLYPLLIEGRFQSVQVSPRLVYMDPSKPALMDSFVRKTIIPMVEGVRDQVLELGLMDEADWDRGIDDLHEVADSGQGAFAYTFFKAIGVK